MRNTTHYLLVDHIKENGDVQPSILEGVYSPCYPTPSGYHDIEIIPVFFDDSDILYIWGNVLSYWGVSAFSKGHKVVSVADRGLVERMFRFIVEQLVEEYKERGMNPPKLERTLVF